MKVDEYVEHENGSATITMEMTPDETQLVIQVGLLKMITDMSKHEEKRLVDLNEKEIK